MNIITANIEVQTDSYKLNHWNQYVPGTEFVGSYSEARSGATYPETVWFGLQAILKRHFVGKVVTRDGIEEAAEICKHHFANELYFNRKGWEHILKVHDGKLPLLIQAVPEGMPVTINNILMSVINTDPKCAWLTNAVESVLTHTWYPSTVATLSYNVKKMMKQFLEETADTCNALPFMLHDFGYRGASCQEAASIGGAGHLINFLGTDTVPAMRFARAYYNASYKGLAYSVAATEHSIMTSKGPHGEAEIIDTLLNNYPTGILSVVSDSYDIYENVSEYVCRRFKHRILQRDGIYVVRPDSITPLHKTPEELTLWIVRELANAFGYTTNTKGYDVLNPKIRVLWGDGIDMAGIRKILQTLKDNKFSAENMVFGMGGGLLQKVNRDTQRFAFKCSRQYRNGVWHDIYKMPKDLSKASKRGNLALIKEGLSYKTIRVEELNGRQNILRDVYRNGELLIDQTFDEVRANAIF